MYCNKCGKELSQDSAYCCYCGAKIAPQSSKELDRFLEMWRETAENNKEPAANNSSSNSINESTKGLSDSVLKSATSSKKSRLPIYIVIGVIVIGLSIFLLRTPVDTTPVKHTNNSNGSTTSSDYKSDFDAPTPVAEPNSGTILTGEEGYESEITIKTDSNPCVVKLKDTYGNTVVSFYVRAWDTVTVGLPAREMYAYFASGETWYGEYELFGEYTWYSKDDTVIDFSQYTMTYTLYPVTNGNFQQTPVDESEFR